MMKHGVSDMAKFVVKQINMTSEQRRIINESAKKGICPDFYDRYLNATNFPTADKIRAAYNDYQIVAEIEATDLEDVFEIGNMGPESAITRLAPMHSLSVGDIVVTPEGKEYFVASFGFEEV